MRDPDLDKKLRMHYPALRRDLESTILSKRRDRGHVTSAMRRE